MKIKALALSLFLLFPLSALSFHGAIDEEVLADYRKHDPVVIFLCDENQSQAKIYQGSVWIRVPYQLTELSLPEGDVLITFGISIGEGYTNFYYKSPDNPLTVFEPERFFQVLANSEQIFRFLRGQKNDCAQTFHA